MIQVIHWFQEHRSIISFFSSLWKFLDRFVILPFCWPIKLRSTMFVASLEANIQKTASLLKTIEASASEPRFSVASKMSLLKPVKSRQRFKQAKLGKGKEMGSWTQQNWLRWFDKESKETKPKQTQTVWRPHQQMKDGLWFVKRLSCVS